MYTHEKIDILQSWLPATSYIVVSISEMMIIMRHHRVHRRHHHRVHRRCHHRAHRRPQRPPNCEQMLAYGQKLWIFWGGSPSSIACITQWFRPRNRKFFAHHSSNSSTVHGRTTSCDACNYRNEHISLSGCVHRSRACIKRARYRLYNSRTYGNFRKVSTVVAAVLPATTVLLLVFETLPWRSCDDWRWYNTKLTSQNSEKR